ncbi:hypothetical protein V6N11_035389 [Hibiscus sabdariffa]|uniref:RNase H type-1 domain-containing protein n=1 Tax=Hibiscus sabdariffa TaxID=183260 RepID=A0ABR2R0C6_9ROSI
MHSSISLNSCSSLWRALSNVWDALLSNVAWLLGNGHSVNFLTDIWVPTLRPLWDYSRASPDAMSHVSFGSVLTDNGEWDVAKLAMIFTEDALLYILGVKPPSPHDGPDRCIWRWTNHHGFELKSAYDKCAPLVLEDPDPLWNQKLQVPQRKLRNLLFIQSGIAHVSNRSGGILFRPLSQALSSPHPLRNDAVFAGDSASVECALSRGIAWAQYCYDGWLQHMPSVSSPLSTTPWSNPEPGCLCLNGDGAVSLKTGKATIGGLLWDTAGNFIFGFSKFIGSTNSLYAELWSLYVGLQLAWDHGVTFLQIQTNCKRVLELLHDPNVESCPISLVRSIHQFWCRAWYVDLIWIPRLSNKATDNLARFANLSSFDLSFFSTQPARLCDVLVADTLALSL